ncbi:MAG: tetratricopeptide repeat protein [Ignavibacteria bacterium]|nr:tetratricopeptide repeat protein [Ignavibacteria bacterium]
MKPLSRLIQYSFLFFALSLLIGCSGSILEKPDKYPRNSTDAQNAKIQKGIEFFDNGKYTEAINTYQEVLTENPDNVWALYEQSMTYSKIGDYNKSLSTAILGSTFQSKYINDFYLLIGNAYDNLGKSAEALKVYKYGLDQAPQNSMLWFNQGVTQFKVGKSEEARNSFKNAIILNPKHASSYYALATVYLASTAYRVPAILTIARFLILEPVGKRADLMRKELRKAIDGNVEKGENANSFNVLITTNQPVDEGNFAALDMILGLSGAAQKSEKAKGESEYINSTLLLIIESLDKKSDNTLFIYTHLLPYFKELQSKKYTAIMTDYILQKKNNTDPAVKNFIKWSESYDWEKSGN